MIEDLQELLNYCNEEIEYLGDKNINSEQDVGCYETFINIRNRISNIIERDKEDQLVFIEPPKHTIILPPNYWDTLEFKGVVNLTKTTGLIIYKAIKNKASYLVLEETTGNPDINDQTPWKTIKQFTIKGLKRVRQLGKKLSHFK